MNKKAAYLIMFEGLYVFLPTTYKDKKYAKLKHRTLFPYLQLFIQFLQEIILIRGVLYNLSCKSALLQQLKTPLSLGISVLEFFS